jgi:hypothetical protein
MMNGPVFRKPRPRSQPGHSLPFQQTLRQLFVLAVSAVSHQYRYLSVTKDVITLYLHPQAWWRIKSDNDSGRLMAVRTCKVTCRDPQGVEHTVEVSAQSLYEAVA